MKGFILIFFFYCLSVCAEDFFEENNRNLKFFFPNELSELQITNWKQPTREDWVQIDEVIRKNVARLIHTTEEERTAYTGAKELGWITNRMNKVNFIDPINPDEKPIFKAVYYNNNPDKKDKCIVCYTSFPSIEINWRRCIRLMKLALKKINYKGHLLYRIGGWPSLERERLKYADVPYTFKPFFLEEARDLGYEKILWLDACVMPLTNLKPIFKHLEKHGCGFFSYGGPMPSVFLEPRMYVMHSLGYHPETIEDISTRVIGINTKHPRGNKLLDAWLHAAELKLPFCEPNGDQLSFAAIVNNEGFLDCEFPRNFFQETGDMKISRPYYPGAQLSHQIGLANPRLGDPDENDLFEIDNVKNSLATDDDVQKID